MAGGMLSAPQQQTMQPEPEAGRLLGFFFLLVAEVWDFRV